MVIRECIFMYAAAAKSLQSYPTLCDPIDSNPPGSSLPGILQARILEQVVIPFSRGSSRSKDQARPSCIASGSLPSETLGKPIFLFTQFSSDQSLSRV